MKMNETVKTFLSRVYNDVAVQGVKPVVNRKNLDKLYEEYF